MLPEETTTTVDGMRMVRQQSEIQELVSSDCAAGKTVGFVPTMGALHAGHLSLVEASNRENSVTVVSIFVNSAQFSPGEDLNEYPRRESEDLESLSRYDVDYVFAPTQDEMYPANFSTYITPPTVALPLEGRCRPNHFQGVTTVVLKLFQLVPAQKAYFGLKDYQQTLVIRKMVRDLNLPVHIVACPIVRDTDGLALSSRNKYLTENERQQALALSKSLRVAADQVECGQRDAASIVTRMRQEFAKRGVSRIDYIALVEPETLLDVREIRSPTLATVAAYVGTTRLIDNRLIVL